MQLFYLHRLCLCPAWGASDLTRHHAISRQPDLIVFPPDRDVGA